MNLLKQIEVMSGQSISADGGKDTSRTRGRGPVKKCTVSVRKLKDGIRFVPTIDKLTASDHNVKAGDKFRPVAYGKGILALIRDDNAGYTMVSGGHKRKETALRFYKHVSFSPIPNQEMELNEELTSKCNGEAIVFNCPAWVSPALEASA